MMDGSNPIKEPFFSDGVSVTFSIASDVSLPKDREIPSMAAIDSDSESSSASPMYSTKEAKNANIFDKLFQWDYESCASSTCMAIASNECSGAFLECVSYPTDGAEVARKHGKPAMRRKKKERNEHEHIAIETIYEEMSEAPAPKEPIAESPQSKSPANSPSRTAPSARRFSMGFIRKEEEQETLSVASSEKSDSSKTPSAPEQKPLGRTSIALRKRRSEFSDLSDSESDESDRTDDSTESDDQGLFDSEFGELDFVDRLGFPFKPEREESGMVTELSSDSSELSSDSSQEDWSVQMRMKRLDMKRRYMEEKYLEPSFELCADFTPKNKEASKKTAAAPAPLRPAEKQKPAFFKLGRWGK